LAAFALATLLLVVGTLAALAPPANGYDYLHVAGFNVSDDLATATVTFAGDDGATESGLDGGSHTILNHELKIDLAFTNEPVAQTRKVTISDGRVSGDLSIEFYPASYYASIGADLAGVILLDTTLPRAGAASLGPGMDTGLTPQDETTPSAPKWADARAKGLAPTISGSAPNAVRDLYLQLDRLNDPGVGRECSEQASGIDTFMGVVSHDCWVWCTGNALILRGFLRSAGIPARVVALNPESTYLPDGVLVESSEGHGTVEWWDGTKWAWMGPTTRSLRATGPDGEALSTQELIDALASDERDQIQFTRLDPAAGTWVTRSYAGEDADFKDSLRRAFSPDKNLVGVGRTAAYGSALTGALWFVAGASVATALVARIRRRRPRLRRAWPTA
jgi:hypothetical protein